MYGGSSSSGSKWSLGAKTFRAPTRQERARDENDRYVKELERRKLEAIKHEEKRLRETNKLEREVERVSSRALLGVGSTSSPYLRTRARSFGGFGSSPYLSDRVVGGGYSPMLDGYPSGSTMGGSLLGGDQALIDRRRREAELSQLRARRRALEVEAARRQRSASMVSHAGLVSSPRLTLSGSPYLGTPVYGHSSLGVPRTTTGFDGGLRRTRSFGSLPNHLVRGGPQHHHQQYLTSPILPYSDHHRYPGHSPRGLSPGRLTPPRVINNYTIHNVSPHLDPVEYDNRHHPHHLYDAYGNNSPRLGGYLGGLNDRACYDSSSGDLPYIDPLEYRDELGTSGAQEDFVVTDLDFDEGGRNILSELGYVEGISPTATLAVSEDERLEFAISDLTVNARQLGANGVLAVETGMDGAGMGEVIVRGRAVILG